MEGKHISRHIGPLLEKVECSALWPPFWDASQYHHVVARLEASTHFEYLTLHQITREFLKTIIKKLKSLVHGSQRDALQKEMNSNIRQRVELHADGNKLGQFIQLTQGRTRLPNTPIGSGGLDRRPLPHQALSHRLLQRLALHPENAGPCCRLHSNLLALLTISS
jgi:hypothetical protein